MTISSTMLMNTMNCQYDTIIASVPFNWWFLVNNENLTFLDTSNQEYSLWITWTRLPAIINSTAADVLPIWLTFILAECFRPWTFLEYWNWTCYHRTPSCQINIINYDIHKRSSGFCSYLSFRCMVPWIKHLPASCVLLQTCFIILNSVYV